MPWDDAKKPYDRDKPIHRINLLAVQPPETQADGFGYRCKCRSPRLGTGPTDDVPPRFFDPRHPVDSANSVKREIARELIRTIPGWVPVRDVRERELEGTLDRSFQTWTDVPVFQWHRYYDWNFHVVPADGLGYIKGAGNTQDPTTPPFQHVTGPNSMECEWDCGSWFIPANDFTPGLMFARDACWPMTNQYVWATGRWIYDCGHASSENKTGVNEGKMRSELHPMKAVAVGRWEAFKFAENAFPVPAMQFMFFASKFGGYVNFSTIRDRDYEFIVDLPDPGVTAGQVVNVGHTMGDPSNTAAARGPELVTNPDFSSFAYAKGNVRRVNPVVTLISYSPPQAKVKIPMSTLPADAESYGVVLSLGWKDKPDNTLAKKVKQVTVTLDNIKINKAAHGTLPENWLAKVGVNGRWFAQKQGLIMSNSTINFNKTVTLFLSEDDSVVVSSHGGVLNRVHAVFAKSEGDRSIAGVTDYDRQIVNCSHDEALVLMDEMIKQMWSTFNDQNKSLGLIDPGHAASGPGNPLKVGTNLGEQTFAMKAFFTQDDPQSAELTENPTQLEYTLNYRVKFEKVPGL
jgi:hypothetical protein